MDTLRKYGVDGPDVRMFVQLFWHQRAELRVGDDAIEWVNIERGVRWGRVLATDLSFLYTHLKMEEVRDLKGVRIGGRNFNIIRYADDMVLIADSEEMLHNLADRLEEERIRMGLKSNIGKTEVMGVTNSESFYRSTSP